MTEKDRLGEKLHDKGKAEENRYIQQQEELRLARLKAARPGGEVGRGACPRDGERLGQRTVRGITLDVCPACGGVWLDNGELEAILRDEVEPAVTRWLRSVLGR